MVLNGKVLYEKAVGINFLHRKFDIVLTFDSKEEARDFYDSFDYDNKKLRRERLAIFLCKHEDTSKLDVGSTTHHYIHCAKCNMATSVDDETEEDKLSRHKKFELIFKRDDIRQLEDDIKDLTRALDRKKESLSKLEKEFEEQ